MKDFRPGDVVYTRDFDDGVACYPRPPTNDGKWKIVDGRSDKKTGWRRVA